MCGGALPLIMGTGEPESIQIFARVEKEVDDHSVATIQMPSSTTTTTTRTWNTQRMIPSRRRRRKLEALWGLTATLLSYQPFVEVNAQQSRQLSSETTTTTTTTTTSIDWHQNVYGESLQSCSRDGMALASSTGMCQGQDNSSTSEDMSIATLCIDLTTLSHPQQFCQVLQKESETNDHLFLKDLCHSDYDTMPCQEDANQHCPVEHVCVAPTTLTAYIAASGGCLAIGELVCDSVNLQALETLELAGNTYKDMLTCLIDRCGLHLNYSNKASALTSGGVGNQWVNMAGYSAALVGMVLGAFLFLRSTSRDSGEDDEEQQKKLRPSSTMTNATAEMGVASELSLQIEEGDDDNYTEALDNAPNGVPAL